MSDRASFSFNFCFVWCIYCVGGLLEILIIRQRLDKQYHVDKIVIYFVIACRKSLGQKDGRANEYIPREVSSSPNGEAQTPRNGYGAMRGLEAVGSRMKNSKSLQNLETATVDSLRTVVERTGGLGTNVRHRYGSHVDVARGKYEQLDDTENDAEGSQELRWR
jgi:hypothetical protein